MSVRAKVLIGQKAEGAGKGVSCFDMLISGSCLSIRTSQRVGSCFSVHNLHKRKSYNGEKTAAYIFALVRMGSSISLRGMMSAFKGHGYASIH